MNQPTLTAQEVKDIRRELGLTQTELAVLIGVSRGAVAWWETGGQIPTPLACYALSAALRAHRQNRTEGTDDDTGR